jgi:hypothetical protein
LIGNNSLNGTVPFLKGERTARVDRRWEVPAKSILVSPSYKTQYWIADISNSGFTINVDLVFETEWELFLITIYRGTTKRQKYILGSNLLYPLASAVSP